MVHAAKITSLLLLSTIVHAAQPEQPTVGNDLDVIPASWIDDLAVALSPPDAEVVLDAYSEYCDQSAHLRDPDPKPSAVDPLGYLIASMDSQSGLIRQWATADDGFFQAIDAHVDRDLLDLFKARRTRQLFTLPRSAPNAEATLDLVDVTPVKALVSDEQVVRYMMAYEIKAVTLAKQSFDAIRGALAKMRREVKHIDEDDDDLADRLRASQSEHAEELARLNVSVAQLNRRTLTGLEDVLDDTRYATVLWTYWQIAFPELIPKRDERRQLDELAVEDDSGQVGRIRDEYVDALTAVMSEAVAEEAAYRDEYETTRTQTAMPEVRRERARRIAKHQSDASSLAEDAVTHARQILKKGK